MEPDEFETYNDGVVIGMIVTGAIGAFITGVCMIHFLLEVKKRPIDGKMFWSSFLSILTMFFFCLGASVWRTDALFDIDFKTNDDTPCNISFGVSFTFYGLSKLFLVCMFTYRIQLVFEQSRHLSVNERYLQLARAFTLVMTVVCLIGIVGYVPKYPATTKSGDIWLCTGNPELKFNFGNISIFLFILVDLVASGTLLFLYVKKLHAVAKTLLHMGDGLKPSYAKLIGQLVKSTSLASTAIISTWIFVLAGMFAIPDIGWFVTVDATINAVCVYLMFSFSERAYLLLCKPCALGCYCCFAGWNAAQEAARDDKFLRVAVENDFESKKDAALGNASGGIDNQILEGNRSPSGGSSVSAESGNTNNKFPDVVLPVKSTTGFVGSSMQTMETAQREERADTTER